MRRSLLIMLVWMFGTAIYAAEKPTEAPTDARPAASPADVIRAATAKAHAALYEQIAQLPVGQQLTVGQFLKHMNAQEEFQQQLNRADQIGGPRWIDRNTCQIQLEISAARVAQTLQQIAGAQPRRSPLNAAQIAREASHWPEPMITATATSASSIALVELRPPGGAWASVNNEARQQALRDASAAAVRQTIDSISQVKLGDDQTIGSAMKKPEVARTVNEWLISRPVTRVNFRDDMQVEVFLSIDPREFFDELRSAMANARDLALPNTPQGWERVWADYLAKCRPPVGLARITAGMPKTGVFRMPSVAPAWTEEAIGIEGAAPIISSKLRSAVRAETDARAKLRAKVESLELGKGVTVGQAAEQDHRVRDVVYRFVKQSRIYKTEYKPDGTVVVYLTADPRDLWDDLRP